MIAKSHRWQLTAMTAAALLSLWGSNAAALSLGRITVLSALGEPLRAEIDVLDINADEAASLKATVALPEAFRAAGLEYNPAMSGLQVSLQRRTNGRAFIRLSSVRAINDPFVDMILEANWATGRIVRDYTMLFDPPSLRQATPAAPTPAQIPAQGAVGRAAAPTQIAPAAPLPSMARPAEPIRSTAKVPARPAPIAKPAGNESGQVIVKPGDTASKIAAATKPANVSLDQMLVALLRANPAAFMGDNVNRVKAGSVMNVPTAGQAAATPADDAAQIIVAQSKDFNEFRRRLAGSAPSTPVATADRQASGNVQAKVEDKKPATTAPDKLTLSKGAIQGMPAEEQLANERSAQEAASRAAEIAKNINDLSKLGAASSAVVPAPTAVLATGAAASAPVPAASAVAKPAVAAAVLPLEPGLIDGLTENPLVPAGAIGLIALLAGFGLYRRRQHKNASQDDSSFLESRLRPDSFFGASGGQSVNTNDSAVTGTSMVYSPSQLDAVDDVDPVAEADVYLAYGRDLQAEEILNEALRTNPERVAIHQKLLEIFAKRRDTKRFEDTATLAYHVTSGNGMDWERICELGLSIDPSNALYLPGGQPDRPQDSPPSIPAPLDFTGGLPESADPVLQTQSNVPLPAGRAVDMDLDLDFSLDEEPASEISETKASNADSVPSTFEVDFELDAEEIEAPEPANAVEITEAVEFSLPELDVADTALTPPSVDSDDFKLQAANSFGATAPAPLATAPAPLTSAEPTALPSSDFGMLEFDLGSLSLDLGDDAKAQATTTPAMHEDPLATKLALAEEFSAIGDDDGARALIEEVIAEAAGDMKIKAQRALSSL